MSGAVTTVTVTGDSEVSTTTLLSETTVTEVLVSVVSTNVSGC
jgi:hypothetical protein